MLYCSSECGSISIMQLRTIYCNTHLYSYISCVLMFTCTCICLSFHLFIEMLVSNISKEHCSIYWKFKGIQNNIMHALNTVSHGAIFLATDLNIYALNNI